MDASLINQYPIGFDESKNMTDQFNLHSGLRSNMSGDTILFYGWMNNTSKQNLSIKPYVIELKTEEHYRCTPFRPGKDVLIRPGDTQFFSYAFVPVNNKRIYQHTSLAGDLNKSYSIQLNFIFDEHAKRISKSDIIFTVNSDDWSMYSERMASDHQFTLYDMKKPSEEQLREQDQHIRKLYRLLQINKPHVNLRCSETEILMNDIVLTNKLFAYKDSLYLNVRLINHGNFSLHFIPDSLHVNHPAQNYVRGNTSIQKGEQILLKKGDRFQKLINLGSQGNAADIISVDFSSLKLHHNNKEIFTYHPVFKKR